MAEAIQLKVYTPAGEVLSEFVESVTLQNSEGEIGILPGHARYIGLLGTGVLRYLKSDGAGESLVASEGFCHVTENIVTVLADRVDLRSDDASANFSAEKAAVQRELQSANLFDPQWEAKLVELKRLEALERLGG